MTQYTSLQQIRYTRLSVLRVVAALGSEHQINMCRNRRAEQSQRRAKTCIMYSMEEKGALVFAQ